MQETNIIGRLGSDAEIKDFDNGKQVINFNVAVSEKYKSAAGEIVENTYWYNCAWWMNNTKIANYLKKGTQVFVRGNCSARAYLKEGNAIGVLELRVRELTLLGSSNNTNNSTSPQNTNNNAPTNSAAHNFETEENDLPF